MIAVIADDFTGAAEIGGVGVRYGLKVLIETIVYEVDDVDLLIIATDTRSMEAKAASAEVEKIVSQLISLKPEFIYKKIDSVLRGHIANELETVMHLTGKKSALIVAPNPLVGRTIVRGEYFVDGLPLNETFFAGDPDFPVRSAFVTDIVKSSDYPVFSVGLNDNWPASGLLIANVTSHGELTKWSIRVNPEMILAGGSGFFDALLGTLYQMKVSSLQPDLAFGKSSLFIFGSLFPKSATLLEKFDPSEIIRMNMPENIYYATQSVEEAMEHWAVKVASALASGFSIMVTIDYLPGVEEGLSYRIRERIGQLVAKVAALFNLSDLFIEGGATTSTVLKYMHISKLTPFYEADFGVIQMKAEGYPNLCITTKPGSYLWPGNVKFCSTKA
jgi:uncharacterized protein YgbK (DUF1537 family)